MDNENYQNYQNIQPEHGPNTETNNFCLDQRNLNPNQEYQIERTKEYLTALHSDIDSVHNQVLTESQVVIAHAEGEIIYENPGHENPNL